VQLNRLFNTKEIVGRSQQYKVKMLGSAELLKKRTRPTRTVGKRGGENGAAVLWLGRAKVLSRHHYPP
jgi:hypothetical protein